MKLVVYLYKPMLLKKRGWSVKKYNIKKKSLSDLNRIILCGVTSWDLILSRIPVIKGISLPNRKTFLVIDIFALSLVKRIMNSSKWGPRDLRMGKSAMIAYYITRQLLSRPAPVLIMLSIFSKKRIRGDLSASLLYYYAAADVVFCIVFNCCSRLLDLLFRTSQICLFAFRTSVCVSAFIALLFHLS